MSITDELREWKGNIIADLRPEMVLTLRRQLNGIADRIDREHRMALEKVAAEVDESERRGFDQGFASADDWLAQHEDAMAEHGWVRLPLDADGVPIRPGDALTIVETGEHIRAYDIELYDDGRWLVGDDETMDSIHPDRLRHRAQTVEDVLREFADDVYADSPNVLRNRDAIVERYAAKLRLAEGVDA